MAHHFDLCVIGSGPAGEKGAAQAAYFGKSVCLVEQAPKPGGAAVNTGTLPAKTLRETALYFSGLRHRGLYGVDYRIKTDLSIGDFMYRERAVLDASWTQVSANLKRHNVTQFQGNARFIDPGTIEVTRYKEPTQRITADVFLVATGARPFRPVEVPFDGRLVIDSNDVFGLTEIPKRLIIVGGGMIGSEFASIFGALGSKITLVNNRAHLMSQFDSEVTDTLRREMTRRFGVHVMSDVAPYHIRVRDNLVTIVLTDGRELFADCVLWCSGRSGNTELLGLEAADVKTNDRGFITVNNKFCTSNPGIYAAGDVIGKPALASIAMEEARVAMCHAFDLRYKTEIAKTVPIGVWTIPEIATVGMTEDDARARSIPVETGRASFRENPRGQIIGETEGFVKLVFKADDQRLLGASALGEGASEIIHIPAAVISCGGGLDHFIQGVFSYPTLADAFKYAAYDGLQRLQKQVSDSMEPRSRTGGGPP